MVALPEIVIGGLTWHLQRFSEADPDGLVFVGEKGAQLRRSNFTKIWAKAIKDAGLPAIHIHDLRHTGNTLAAMTGASLKDDGEDGDDPSPAGAKINWSGANLARE
ncbi:tyrosine-type recombinase/integrase [Planobispora siamensis]|uniref:Tyr recombinase domain-containing protein n=1 Tax=Planobispora siamensis TaxID=936338 RepID=A0A8J3SE37_9ACTN|nr:tyrosine-type recombinase/integrase [Planobispora siamensis]GIH91167.1 hypothetical protein Psi01_17970 [Planobispora siamensis]